MSLNYSYASPTRSLTWEIPDRHQLGLSFSKQFGFGGTISIDAIDILGSFGPRFFSTDSYSYRRNLRTYPGIFILTYTRTGVTSRPIPESSYSLTGRPSGTNLSEKHRTAPPADFRAGLKAINP